MSEPKKSFSNPLGLVYYDAENDICLFEVFTTRPGVTIRLPEAAGAAFCMAQYFAGQITLRDAKAELDIEATLREAEEKSEPLIHLPNGKRECVCGHRSTTHSVLHVNPPANYPCKSAGCPCKGYNEAPRL